METTLLISEMSFLETMTQIKSLTKEQQVNLNDIPQFLHEDIKATLNPSDFVWKEGKYCIAKDNYKKWITKVYSVRGFNYPIHWQMENRTKSIQ